MGKMGSATCVVCGRELPIEQMELTFTGRPKYRCYKCVAEGNKQAKARMDESYAIRYAKGMKENKWK